MSSMSRFIGWTAAFGFLTSIAWCAGESDSKAIKSPKPAVSEQQIAEWAEQLDSDSFRARQEATRKLIETGAAAVPFMRKAAEGKSLERATRAVDVLKQIAKKDELRQAARKVLQELTKSENRSVAQRAAEALEPKKTPSDDNQIIQGPGGIQIQIGGGGGFGARVIQVQAQAIGGGTKNIQVQENGKKISIKEDAKGIEMSVTETVDGKEKTNSYKAKNAEELKKKHPEAFKVYEKYSKNAGPAAILRRFKIRPVAPRIVPRIVRPLPAQPDPQQKIKDVLKQLQETADQIHEAAKNADQAKPGELLEKIEQLQEQVRKVQADLEK